MFETLSEERSLTNDSLIEGGQEIKRIGFSRRAAASHVRRENLLIF